MMEVFDSWDLYSSNYVIKSFINFDGSKISSKSKSSRLCILK